MTGTTPLSSDLAHRVRAGLDAVGRAHTFDWQTETFETADGLVGVVAQQGPGIVLYAVADDVVGQEARERVALATAYLNSRLAGTAVEIDMANGLLSVRAAVLVGDLVLLPEDLGGLVDVAARAVHEAWGRVRDLLAAVGAGTLDPAAAGRALDV